MSNDSVVTVYSKNNIAVFAAGIQGATGPGVPSGGSAGQLLSKIDGTSYNTQWVTKTNATVTLTGDVTGSGTASLPSTIAANVVSNSKLAQMPANTIKGNRGTATANVSDLSAAQVRGLLGVKPALQMVATRCGINSAAGGQYSTSQPGCITRMQHCLPYGAKSLYPIYSAFYVTTSNPDTETASPGGFGWYASAATVVAGGTSYAVGDRITVSGVATNQFPPVLQVEAVSSGVVTALSVVDGGGFAATPSTGLTTTKITGSGNNGLTVTLTLTPCAFVMQAAIEQSWNTQTAVSASNVSGVMKLTAGANGALGKGNIVVPYTEAVACDSVQVGLTAGATIGTRLYTPSTGFYVARYLSGTAGLSEAGHANIALASAAPYGGTFPTYASPAAGFQPIAIMGIPQMPGPTFVLIGDSIGYGIVSAGGSTSHDTLDANGNGGYLERAINQTAPYSNFCTPADRLSNWLNQTGATIRMRLLQMLNASHVVDQMGINDLYAGGTSYTTFKAQKIKFWQMLMGLGVKEIWATTITPNTTSTDGWATTANQTVTSANTAIQAFNTDLRNGVFSSYVARVLDLGTSAESTVGSGLWPANGTGDGLHPTQSQVATMASAIASNFALATL